MPLHLPWLRQRLRPTSACRPAKSCRPSMEALEDRCLPSSYTVTTTNDILGDVAPGEVTLRDVLTAISTQAASGNAAAGTASNTIRFAIGAKGTVQTIRVGSGNVAAPLPALAHQAFIDGWSQGAANYSGPPLIVLNGAGAGSGADGLELDAGSSGSTVRGLVIQQFTNNGIEVKGATGNLIAGNYIGTDAAGASPLGNGNDGVLLGTGTRGNTIGGTAAGAGNVISANGTSSSLTGSGVEIAGSGSSGNSVLGNLIGTDKTATIALGNALDGIRIDNSASGNTIGGTAAGSANIICGSLNVTGSTPGPQAAVFSLGAASISGNIARFDIAVNYIDTPPMQMVYSGIDVRMSSAALAPVSPITHLSDFSAFNFLPSSTLGTNWGPVGNGFAGEFLYHTPPSSGGQPSGLAPNATYLVGTLTYDLAKFGITPSSSLLISIAGTDTVIGAQVPGNPATFKFVNPTFTAGQQPLVPGKATAGVAINGGGTSRNVVVGNFIGTSMSGTAKLGHFTSGVLIDSGAASNTVGDAAPGGANVVAGNDDGITLSDSGTIGNVVLGNRIGTDPRATANLGNTLAGVFLENGAASNTIGGILPGSGNVIAFGGKGVVVGNSPSDTATIHDSILGNNIFGNTGPAISLGNQGPTPNGANPRAYPNDGQNTPTISALTLQSISGGLTSVPNTTFRIEVFAMPVGGGPQVFLGFVNVTTDATGNVRFTLPVATLALGNVVTATATNLTSGDTSESSPVGTQLLVFSNPIIASSNVPQVVTLSAQLFAGNKPVTTGQVMFSILGLPGQVTATPNANGVATVNFTLPAGVTPGQYTVIATFVGEGEIAGATGSGLVTILPPVGKVGRRWAR